MHWRNSGNTSKNERAGLQRYPFQKFHVEDSYRLVVERDRAMFEGRHVLTFEEEEQKKREVDGESCQVRKIKRWTLRVSSKNILPTKVSGDRCHLSVLHACHFARR